MGRFYFRVIETDDGTWLVRRGSHELDRYGDRHDAVTRARAIARRHQPSEVFLHTLDGDVRSVVVFDQQPTNKTSDLRASP